MGETDWVYIIDNYADFVIKNFYGMIYVHFDGLFVYAIEHVDYLSFCVCNIILKCR